MDYYGVMGNPIAHSLSPRVHQLFARQTQRPIHYTAILVEKDNLAGALSDFQNHHGKGVNITAPFKQEAFTLVDQATPRATQSQTVNTIRFNPDGTRTGDNTDGVGLIKDILINQSVRIHNKQILLLGAGGAAHAVLDAILEQKPARVVIANRTLVKAQRLAEKTAANIPVQACHYPDLAENQYDLVINATSSGLVVPLPTGILKQNACCYDMTYNEKPSAFLQWAYQQGAVCCQNGLGMLVEQAAESWYFWFGIRPESQNVISFLHENYRDFGAIELVLK